MKPELHRRAEAKSGRAQPGGWMATVFQKAALQVVGSTDVDRGEECGEEVGRLTLDGKPMSGG